MNLTKLIELQASAISVPNSRYASIAFEVHARNFDFAAMDAKIKRYEDALRFYADEDNHFMHVSDYGVLSSPVDMDEGSRARKALDGTE